jgi:hypothetical protein
MPSAAATSASLFRPAGGAAMAQPKAAAPRVLSHPEARPWLGPLEPERERREGERGGAERKRMPVEQSRWIFIEDSRQCFGVCFGTVDYISDCHFSMRESTAKI